MLQKMILQALLHSLLGKSDKSMVASYEEPVAVVEVEELPGSLELSDVETAKEDDIDVEAMLKLFSKG